MDFVANLLHAPREFVGICQEELIGSTSIRPTVIENDIGVTNVSEARADKYPGSIED